MLSNIYNDTFFGYNPGNSSVAMGIAFSALTIIVIATAKCIFSQKKNNDLEVKHKEFTREPRNFSPHQGFQTIVPITKPQVPGLRELLYKNDLHH
jgi:hypothetical protein